MLDNPSRNTRIAILSSAGGGGGGIAAKRMADTLNTEAGFEADFLSGEFFAGFLPQEVAPMKSFSNQRHTDTHYTLEYPGYTRQWMVDLLAGYDIVNVHWASYLLSLGELDALSRRGTRMLFMLHDFHYITGGCHYPAGCTGLMRGCMHCPQFDETQGDINFVPVNLRIKQSIFARPNAHLAAPSQWLRDQAVATGIVPDTRAHVLRNPYHPVMPQAAWPDDGTVRILVIADSLTERRKGMPLALKSLARLAERLSVETPERRVVVHIVGAADQALREGLEKCPLEHRIHGRITDHGTLAEIFAICDIVLSCSLEDNWPNILVEAGAYGCVPVVGPGHGCEEFARRYTIGTVTPEYTAEAFAEAMLVTIASLPAAPARAANMARIRDEHDMAQVSRSFLEVVGQISQAAPIR